MTRAAAVALFIACVPALRAADERELPASFTADQKMNMLKFLKEHEKPERFIPKDAKFADAAPPAADKEIAGTKDKPIRQYTVQITPHRPVPDEPKVGRADVFFYRPNPEKGRPGITVKHTIDLATGKQVGETEVLTKAHTAISREELAEAVAEAKDKSAAVKGLYAGREAGDVKWEYLQMKINRKTDQFEPGDRVVRFVFTANAAEGQNPPTPVSVLVNLTKDTVVADGR